jgi:predicted phage terminase large subunit-like protein
MALAAALQFVDVPGYAALVLRKTYASLALADGLMPRAREWLLGQPAVRWVGETNSFEFVTLPGEAPSTLTFGYIRNDSDAVRYHSTAWNTIVWEEVTEHATDAQYRYLFSRQRRPSSGPLAEVPTRTIATANPVGPGFQWVKRRFLKEKKASRVFLPSRLEDNPSIDAADYDAGLQELPEGLYRALRWGDWADFAIGEVFPRDRWQWLQPDQITGRSGTVRYWDLAASEVGPGNPDPDWTAGVKLSQARGGAWVVEHVARARYAPDDVERLIRSVAMADGRSVEICFSQDPGQAGKAQVAALTRMLSGWKVSSVRESGDKLTRALPVSAQQRARGMAIVDDGLGWQNAFVEELEAFPAGGHDDQVDALAGAFNRLTETRSWLAGFADR